MKRLILLSITIFLVFGIAQSQCKYDTSIKGSKQYSISESRPEIEIATPYYALCIRGVTALGFAFSRSDTNDYYLFISVSTFGQVIKINESNSIVIEFSDNSEMTLLPNGSYSGLLRGTTNFAVGAFYKINPEQLMKFSNNSVAYVKVYYTPNTPAKSSSNDDPTYYHDFKIKKNKKIERFIEMANCMLKYN